MQSKFLHEFKTCHVWRSWSAFETQRPCTTLAFVIIGKIFWINSVTLLHGWDIESFTISKSFNATAHNSLDRTVYVKYMFMYIYINTGKYQWFLCKAKGKTMFPSTYAMKKNYIRAVWRHENVWNRFYMNLNRPKWSNIPFSVVWFFSNTFDTIGARVTLGAACSSTVNEHIPDFHEQTKNQVKFSTVNAQKI